MAPELFSEDAKPSTEADMYAFGMVVYEVITGARPYGQRKLMEIPALTIHGLKPSRPEDPMPIGFGQGTWEFAERCWDGNRTQRPLARAALEHFERVAKSSTIVDPGPTIRIQPTGGAPSRRENSSRNLCEYRRPSTKPLSNPPKARLFAPQTNRPARLQQAVFSTRVLVSERSVAAPLLPANGGPGLLDRMRRRLNPVYRLGSSLQGDT